MASMSVTIYRGFGFNINSIGTLLIFNNMCSISVMLSINGIMEMKLKFPLLYLEFFLIRTEITVGASWKPLTTQKNEPNVICAILTRVH